jgi:hypothetical protein
MPSSGVLDPNGGPALLADATADNSRTRATLRAVRVLLRSEDLDEMFRLGSGYFLEFSEFLTHGHGD